MQVVVLASMSISNKRRRSSNEQGEHESGRASVRKHTAWRSNEHAVVVVASLRGRRRQQGVVHKDAADETIEGLMHDNELAICTKRETCRNKFVANGFIQAMIAHTTVASISAETVVESGPESCSFVSPAGVAAGR